MSIAVELPNSIRGRRAGFANDVASVAGRALRLTKRDAEAVIPALIFPVFFFVVNIGALQDMAETIPGMNYKAFQLPVAVLLAVTGVSRAITLVTDIQTGYFDRLSLTPVNHLALLLGLMVADFTLMVALMIPVVILGFALGVTFETGALGVLVFILFGGIWGLVFTGFPYAIALKTGNPAAVNMSFLLFLPFMFLTTISLPKEALTGWLATIATYNPVTYLLDALRSLISVGWDGPSLFYGFIAIGLVGLVSMTLAFMALNGRASKR